MKGNTGETIVAVATPNGRGAIAQIRLSGQLTEKILSDCFHSSQNELVHRQAVVGRFRASGSVIDQVVVTKYKGPNSYTGEDLAEISSHGNPLIYKNIVDACISSGARLAEPGEFTYRAFLNRKIDLSQAEAVSDLVNSQTEYQLRVARRQLEGALSQELQTPKDRLIEVITQMETAIEFVEDDVTTTAKNRLADELKSIRTELVHLADTFEKGRILQEGLKVVLSGRPNTGKSSIFNKLLKYERAIVTPYAGTTRDTLLEKLDIEGIPVLLVDTAGIREGLDPIEKEGVERSKRNLKDADLVLFILDDNSPWSEDDEQIWHEIRGIPYVTVRNKIDLKRKLEIPEEVTVSSSLEVSISAKKETNLHELALSIIRAATPGWKRIEKEGVLVTHLRHQKALIRAADEIGNALVALGSNLSEEYALYDLRKSLNSIGEITGETTSEEILGRIFSTFCIGK